MEKINVTILKLKVVIPIISELRFDPKSSNMEKIQVTILRLKIPIISEFSINFDSQIAILTFSEFQNENG